MFTPGTVPPQPLNFLAAHGALYWCTPEAIADAARPVANDDEPDDYATNAPPDHPLVS